MYEVVALQNQEVDRIRACLGRGDWQLQPGVVKCIYEDVGETSTLRQMVRVDLGHDQPANQPARYVWLQQEAPSRYPYILNHWETKFPQAPPLENQKLKFLEYLYNHQSL